MILDRILATICMGALIAFTSVLVIYIKELDLTIIIVICLAIGVYDFWIDMRRPREKPNDAGSGGPQP